MSTFTLATYGTTNDYSWTTDGWIPAQVPADTDAAKVAAQIAKQATEYHEGEIDAQEYAWEVAQIAKHIQNWLDENQADLMIIANISLDVSLEATYAGGDYRAQVDEDENGGYTISYFNAREIMPAFKTEHYASEKEAIKAMLAINADVSAWQPVEFDY